MLSFIIGIVLCSIFINSIYAFFKQAEVVCPLKIIFFYHSLLPGTKCTNRRSRPEVFLRKDVLKICSEFTGQHSCRSVISIKLLCNFVCCIFSEHLFLRTPLDGCFCTKICLSKIIQKSSLLLISATYCIIASYIA